MRLSESSSACSLGIIVIISSRDSPLPNLMPGNVNHPSLSRAALPFGEFERSARGKELSDLGIQGFVNTKLICAANGFSLVD